MPAKPLLLPLFILTTCLSTAPAAVMIVAEYHLGEGGSLSGSSQLPQDSAGSRNFTTDEFAMGGDALVSTSGVFAPGSTAYLDTSDTGSNASWSGADFSTLPTDNFAFGIYASATSLDGTQGDVFTLGDGYDAFKLSLAPNGWSGSSHNTDWIGEASGVTGSFTPSTWVHLAIVRSSGVSTFYIDGIAQAGTYLGAPVHGASLLSVSPGRSLVFDGLLDEARVVTFDPGEATANVLNALAVPEPGTALLAGLGLLTVLRRRVRV